MAWDPFKKKSWDKANPANWGKKAKDELEKPLNEIKKLLSDADRELTEKLDAAKNVASDATRKANQLKDEISKVDNKIEDGFKKASKEFEGVANKAKKEVEDLTKDVKRELNKLPELAEKELKHALDLLVAAITKEGLKKIRNIVRLVDKKLAILGVTHPKLTDEINKLEFSLEIGPVTLKYVNFYMRVSKVADTLDTYVNNPPEFRREPIINMIKALGPTSIDLGASVQVVAVVVGSKELGIGGNLGSIGIGLFAELGDAILKEIGVPK